MLSRQCHPNRKTEKLGKMPKRFKFRFSGVIPTFHFCRPSKHPSDLPSDPFLSFLHQLSSLPPCLRLRPAAHSSDFKWTKNDNWHVFDPDDSAAALPRRKIYNSAASDDEEEKADVTPLALPLPLPPPKGKRRSRIRRRMKSYGVRLSISSTESGLFSDDEEEEIGAEIETLVSNSNSSRSFSTDSSTEFSPHLETIREGPAIRPNKPKKKRKSRRKVKIGGRRWPPEAAEDEEEEYAAARLSAVFRKLVPCAAAGVEGKVRESLAVVKRSEEPYEDFKRSMVEMIVEKEMVEEKDLQELLRCFLSLNSEQHHGIIIRAFDDICGALFFSESSCLVAR